MATIIQNGDWYTLTPAAAAELHAEGFLYVCSNDHGDVLDADLPIYHVDDLNSRDDKQTILRRIDDAHRRTEPGRL